MWLREQFRALLGLDESPHRTALAFAVGVFLGFSPFLGLHTLLGLGLAFLLRLNRVAVLLGVYTNTPWWIVPFYAFSAWVGYQFLGIPAGEPLPLVNFSDLFQITFWKSLAGQWRLLQAAFWGSLFLAAVLAALSFPVALFLIQRYRGKADPAAPAEPRG